jgi:hypothetical protein
MPPPAYQQTVEAIVGCGVPTANIRIAYEDALQSDVVTISDLGETGEAKFLCLRRAVHPFYVLEIEGAEQQEAYFAFGEREDRREARTEAVEWLRGEGRLNRVPRYDPVRGLEDFARAVEAACAAPAESVLETSGPTYLTFRQSFVERELAAGSGDTFTCVNRMIAASNAEEHGIRVVIVGNEAVSDNRP